MKTTQYFEYRRKGSDRVRISDEWIQLAILKPMRTEIQADGRIRRWVFIEQERRFLRVILLPDGETVHNAFFDSNFRTESQDED